MKEELPQLNFKYDELEPFMDAKTVEIHHSKHHQAYTNNYNAAKEKHPELADKTAEELLSNIETIPQDIKNAIINHGGGYLSHKLFWEILKKDVPLTGEIKEAITSTFGSYENFKKEFSTAAATQFGSGWAWLVVEKGTLKITKTSNQDSPFSIGQTPILCIDVWEHAYYLKFQNQRPAYIENFFNIINWEKVNELYLSAK